MNADAWKKRLLLHLPYGVIGLAAAKLSEAWRLSAGTDFSAKFLHLRDGVAMAFRNGLSGFVPLDLLIGFLCGCALCLLVHAKRRNAKKYRHGEEYGAARWGKPSDIAPFMDADPWNNIILTQTERLTMSSRPANPQNARNKNVLVIGGSGSGKTRFFIKPNIMQCTKTKDLSRVKSKFLFNLTKRQVVCFGLGALIGVPAFFLAKDALGVSPSVLLMMLLMLPFFLLAMFERHGQPLEVLIRHFIQARFVRPRIRVWQNDNFYKTIDRSIRNQQEVQKILRGKQRKNQADKG